MMYWLGVPGGIVASALNAETRSYRLAGLIVSGLGTEGDKEQNGALQDILKEKPAMINFPSDFKDMTQRLDCWQEYAVKVGFSGHVRTGGKELAVDCQRAACARLRRGFQGKSEGGEWDGAGYCALYGAWSGWQRLVRQGIWVCAGVCNRVPFETAFRTKVEVGIWARGALHSILITSFETMIFRYICCPFKVVLVLAKPLRPV